EVGDLGEVRPQLASECHVQVAVPFQPQGLGRPRDGPARLKVIVVLTDPVHTDDDGHVRLPHPAICCEILSYAACNQPSTGVTGNAAAKNHFWRHMTPVYGDMSLRN